MALLLAAETTQQAAELVYRIADDAQETKLYSDIPAGFSQLKQDYSALIGSLKNHQAPAPQQKKMLSPEECKRLEALGYMTCK